ncbi:BLUF domain-containing protein [Azospirillum sp. A1-3]|uniref:BLUF domain-containing protein n=1 Tax=Azospirillum sp. A1-3 TaxID=185874 RepID=UPI0020774E6D|nr:BLUF domain-containing protein [Azospirillum sp. A1-3]MCM8736976.1 BLUF domain-containing protein [Azospirillum sp. A1-3]
MLQIVFRSQLTRLLSYTDIQKLCLASARNNRKAGVTGFMVECGGVFLEAIEGETREVDETFSRVRRDTRHDHMEIVCSENGLERRRFGAWSMNVMFLDDDVFWQTVFGRGFSCDELLSSRALEPAFALGLLAMAYQYACAQAKIEPPPAGARPGRIPRIGHMLRR